MMHRHLVLLGCGILRKEIDSLISKNRWPLRTSFLDSSLRCGNDQIAHCLEGALRALPSGNVFVFYGCCHPCLDGIIREAGALRTDGLNCLEMLLGSELFNAELARGAYFLLEEWARSWPQFLETTFGTRNSEVVAELFRTDRKYLLGLRTPCSGDFRTEAEADARMVGLPLRWRDVSLDNIESVLRTAMSRSWGIISCQTQGA